MNTKVITIRVDAETARMYESASESDRQKLDLLLNLKLRDAMNKKPALEEIMNNISDKAIARGLTPEILESILSES